MNLKVEYRARIDKYISNNSTISRNEIKILLINQQIQVNQIVPRKANFQVKPGDLIEVKPLVVKPLTMKAQNLPLDVVYEDEDLIVINKRSGVVVHPAPGHPDQTLVNALLYHFQELSDLNGPLRPGIVHRIDKDTSGLLVVAKTNQAHQVLAEALKKHQIKRIYYAYVQGRVANQITHINLPIGRDLHHRQKMSVQRVNSKSAITHMYVEKIFDQKTLVRCELETGRTHQIRVHLAYLKHPVWGDPVYGQKIDQFNQRLHAYQLRFQHPSTGEWLEFTAPLPSQFEK